MWEDSLNQDIDIHSPLLLALKTNSSLALHALVLALVSFRNKTSGPAFRVLTSNQSVLDSRTINPVSDFWQTKQWWDTYLVLMFSLIHLTSHSFTIFITIIVVDTSGTSDT
jgi:hypothetical protein